MRSSRKAVIAQDWDAATATLSATRRGSKPHATLAATWAARTRVHGPATGFRITGFSVKNSTARISGTLTYGDGTREDDTVRLIEEPAGWKVASGP